MTVKTINYRKMIQFSQINTLTNVKICCQRRDIDRYFYINIVRFKLNHGKYLANPHKVNS